MLETPRLSRAALKVLKAFLDAYATDVRAEVAGTDLLKATGLQSGTLYPILLRLEKAGVLTSRWETEQPADLGRPRRRFYQVTSSGVQLAHEALAELSSPLAHPLPWNA